MRAPGRRLSLVDPQGSTLCTPHTTHTTPNPPRQREIPVSAAADDPGVSPPCKDAGSTAATRHTANTGFTDTTSAAH